MRRTVGLVVVLVVLASGQVALAAPIGLTPVPLSFDLSGDPNLPFGNIQSGRTSMIPIP